MFDQAYDQRYSISYVLTIQLCTFCYLFQYFVSYHIRWYRCTVFSYFQKYLMCLNFRMILGWWKLNGNSEIYCKRKAYLEYSIWPHVSVINTLYGQLLFYLDYLTYITQILYHGQWGWIGRSFKIRVVVNIIH